MQTNGDFDTGGNKSYKGPEFKTGRNRERGISAAGERRVSAAREGAKSTTGGGGLSLPPGREESLPLGREVALPQGKEVSLPLGRVLNLPSGRACSIAATRERGVFDIEEGRACCMQSLLPWRRVYLSPGREGWCLSCPGEKSLYQ